MISSILTYATNGYDDSDDKKVDPEIIALKTLLATVQLSASNKLLVVRKISLVQQAFQHLSLSQHSFELPEIVFVGGQSSGKTSIVNAMAGFDLLPTASLMCTKRPLRLTLFQSRTTTTIVDGQSNVDIVTFLNECHEVTSTPVDVVHCSPNVLVNVTFVDLPGLIAVHERDRKLPETIRNIVKTYMLATNIIVQVCHARPDLEADEGVRFVRTSSDNTQQLLGVLTKIDTLDKPTLKLTKRRFVDTQDGGFLCGHGYHLTSAMNNTGVQKLAKSLNEIVTLVADKHLPIAKNLLETFVESTGSGYDSYIDTIVHSTDVGEHSAGSSVGKIFAEMSQTIQGTIDTANNDMNDDVDQDSESGYHMGKITSSTLVARLERWWFQLRPQMISLLKKIYMATTTRLRETLLGCVVNRMQYVSECERSFVTTVIDHVIDESISSTYIDTFLHNEFVNLWIDEFDESKSFSELRQLACSEACKRISNVFRSHLMATHVCVLEDRASLRAAFKYVENSDITDVLKLKHAIASTILKIF
jgi:GTP-binding protein EngB required for normal cell division